MPLRGIFRKHVVFVACGLCVACDSLRAFAILAILQN